MKVLITGGAGYIGTELCKRLMDRSDIESIRVYDNLSRKTLISFWEIISSTQKYHSRKRNY